MKVERNDSCPCGSGLKFKKCCLITGKQYITIGEKNYKNQEIIYELGEFKNILSSFTALSEKVKQASFNSSKQLAIEEGIEFTKEFLENIDRFMTQFIKYSPCKEGCYSCCKIIPTITTIEAELIRRYVVDNFPKQQTKAFLESFKKQCEVFPIEYMPDKSDLFLKTDLYCGFLSEDGRCLIYNARPFQCRTYMVLSDQKTCEIDKSAWFIKNELFSINQILTLIMKATYPNIMPVKDLPHWFKEGFEKLTECMRLSEALTNLKHSKDYYKRF